LPRERETPLISVPGLRRSALLVHGAGSGPYVFDGWTDAFGDTDVYGVDLHAGLDVAAASMQNYEAAVACAAGLLRRPLTIVGWSMGGLAAMMAARRVLPEALVLLETSAPGEVQGFDPTVPLRTGTFEGEAVYGTFPPGIPSRPESLLARTERKRGISVPSLPGRTLVVSGREFPEERGSTLAAFYGAEELPFREAGHWDLVLEPEVRRAVARWVA
jgi:pimeloyl-ACP methyl ester carboxylesterase